MSDALINADLWSNKPEMSSAEFTFDGAIGSPPPITEQMKLITMMG